MNSVRILFLIKNHHYRYVHTKLLISNSFDGLLLHLFGHIPSTNFRASLAHQTSTANPHATQKRHATFFSDSALFGGFDSETSKVDAVVKWNEHFQGTAHQRILIKFLRDSSNSHARNEIGDQTQFHVVEASEFSLFPV